jgi:hypothetical protein
VGNQGIKVMAGAEGGLIESKGRTGNAGIGRGGFTFRPAAFRLDTTFSTSSLDFVAEEDQQGIDIHPALRCCRDEVSPQQTARKAQPLLLLYGRDAISFSLRLFIRVPSPSMASPMAFSASGKRSSSSSSI